ncbi:MAG: tyrosine--tRNA ligase [Candidatus Zambryskibacteria bacterium RIFOXYC1_FULL_39_10]|uniref:Tyrosine--tRNA ligase n=1 Tax=Candidatus Zambryskibacteria bacterium RIFOXYC1_FULL_39_10 TaxID=1802779 RepID=A0A1G2V051_9BACT|nr:MAG: tyrosine--tRNA ligase [Candidatus Zambryskibacteria bacterium RIFOXYD1_FULL_39_35]OHB14991.1 MAG: tyrosine--tRNA ligase [Candidatus Zambryskibacteria bacterium RIFOXYC1_FULL_39_10]
MFGTNKPKIITDEDIIEEILTRGVEKVYPNKAAFKEVLMSGKEIRLYYGIDPTGSTLHLGHLVQLLKLRKFQDLGHEVIILIGDFTAQIGDPTDKQATRKPLTHQQVLENAKGYKKQISKILDLGKSNIRFVHNEKWTNKLTPEDLLELASHFTVSNLLTRDMFQERIKAGREVYVHEFLYPIFQAYDAVTMEVDLQIGGNDQMFNMLAGRDLMKRKKNKEMFVLTTKLLIDPTGKKMGKTEDNMITLNDSANDMFGKVMSWPDSMISLGFEMVTNISDEEIKSIQSEFETGKSNPKEYKITLAKEIVKICHGKEAAQKAAETFINTFSKGEFPEDAQIINVSKEEKIMDILVEKKVVESKSEFRRLVEAGAVSDYPDKKINDPNETVGEGERKIKIGKKTFVVLKSS